MQVAGSGNKALASLCRYMTATAFKYQEHTVVVEEGEKNALIGEGLPLCP